MLHKHVLPSRPQAVKHAKLSFDGNDPIAWSRVDKTAMYLSSGLACMTCISACITVIQFLMSTLVLMTGLPASCVNVTAAGGSVAGGSGMSCLISMHAVEQEPPHIRMHYRAVNATASGAHASNTGA